VDKSVVVTKRTLTNCQILCTCDKKWSIFLQLWGAVEIPLVQRLDGGWFRHNSQKSSKSYRIGEFGLDTGDCINR
jgi:hypothetical protein